MTSFTWFHEPDDPVSDTPGPPFRAARMSPRAGWPAHASCPPAIGAFCALAVSLASIVRMAS
jgi:hypothetical protein